jgi:hypothetical protein
VTKRPVDQEIERGAVDRESGVVARSPPSEEMLLPPDLQRLDRAAVMRVYQRACSADISERDVARAAVGSSVTHRRRVNR